MTLHFTHILYLKTRKMRLTLAYRSSCNTYARYIARLSVLSFGLVGNSGFVGLISVGKPKHRGFDSDSFRHVAIGM